MHKYSEKQRTFIIKKSKGISNKELTRLFNKRFKTNIKASQLKSYKSNHGIKSGVSARFKKDATPWNKGMKGLDIGGEDTRFKKGCLPHNYLPIGTERVNGDGYVDIKVAEPNKWKPKQRIIWEKVNGPIPKDYAVIFGDSNNRNFDIDNLILVSRSQLLFLNRNKLIKNNSELTKTGVIIADLNAKLKDLK